MLTEVAIASLIKTLPLHSKNYIRKLMDARPDVGTLFQ